MPITRPGHPTSYLGVVTRGGVNSVAMLIQMAERGIQPEFIIFDRVYPVTTADDRWWSEFRPWLARRFPGSFLLSNVEYIIGAFAHTSGDGRLALGSSSCARESRRESLYLAFIATRGRMQSWATQPWCLAHPYNADEPDRALSLRKWPVPQKGSLSHWSPLIDWGMGDQECRQACATAGLTFYRSQCFACPAKNQGAIALMAMTDPDLIKRALEIEDRHVASGLFGAGFGLGGRDFRWRTFIEADDKQRSAMPEPSIRIPCECYDG